jgi:hypothetical protein
VWNMRRDGKPYDESIRNKDLDTGANNGNIWRGKIKPCLQGGHELSRWRGLRLSQTAPSVKSRRSGGVEAPLPLLPRGAGRPVEACLSGTTTDWPPLQRRVTKLSSLITAIGESSRGSSSGRTSTSQGLPLAGARCQVTSCHLQFHGTTITDCSKHRHEAGDSSRRHPYTADYTARPTWQQIRPRERRHR